MIGRIDRNNFINLILSVFTLAAKGQEKNNHRSLRESPRDERVSCDLWEIAETIYLKSYRLPRISQYHVPFGPCDLGLRPGTDDLTTYLVGLASAKWTDFFLNPDPEWFHCKRVRHTQI